MQAKRAKTCNKCGKTKEIDSFSKRKVSKDGYRNQCRDCEHSYYRDYYARNSFGKARIKNSDPTGVTYKCTHCLELKPEEEFNLAERSPLGIKTLCKKCQKTQWQEYSSRFEDTEDTEDTKDKEVLS